MFKKVAAVLALALASANMASARTSYRAVDLRPYFVSSSTDLSKVLTLKPDTFYNLMPTAADADQTYNVVVKCPTPKKTNGKYAKAFMAYVNVAGNYNTDYVTVDMYDTTGEQVSDIYEYVLAEEAERWLTPSCRCCLLEVRSRLTLPPLNSYSLSYVHSSRPSSYATATTTTTTRCSPASTACSAPAMSKCASRRSRLERREWLRHSGLSGVLFSRLRLYMCL